MVEINYVYLVSRLFTGAIRTHQQAPTPHWIMASQYCCGAQQLFCSCADMHTNEQHLSPSRADASTALQNRIQNLSVPMIPCHNITTTSSSSSLSFSGIYLGTNLFFCFYQLHAGYYPDCSPHDVFLYGENLAFWNQTGPHLFV